CEADLIDGIDEGRGATIHDGDFRAIDLDRHVVDVKASQSRQQVFGGRAKRSFGIAKHGCKLGRGDRAYVGADLALDRPIRRNSLEDNPAVIVGWMERWRNGKAGMNTDARYGDLVA